MTLFTAAFVAAVLCYRRGAGLAVPKSGMPWLGVMALSSSSSREKPPSTRDSCKQTYHSSGTEQRQERSTMREYAGFARDGFFELCRVSVVNLLVLWGLRLFQKTSPQRPTVATRIFDSLLCCQTLLLIALALCKMGLYIRYCGVTWLRVCTTWFMVLLAVVFGLMLLSQFREILQKNVAKHGGKRPAR